MARLSSSACCWGSIRRRLSTSCSLVMALLSAGGAAHATPIRIPNAAGHSRRPAARAPPGTIPRRLLISIRRDAVASSRIGEIHVGVVLRVLQQVLDRLLRVELAVGH